MKEEESEFSEEFVRNIVPKLHWPALLEAAASLGITSLPAEPDAATESEEAMQQLHRALLDVRRRARRALHHPLTDGAARRCTSWRQSWCAAGVVACFRCKTACPTCCCGRTKCDADGRTVRWRPVALPMYMRS